VRHELMRRPFTRTVQAPHCPWSHPFFVPVRSRWLRRASSRVVQGATCSCRAAPLTVRVIRDFAGTEGAAVPTVAPIGCVLMKSPAEGERAGPVRQNLATTPEKVANHVPRLPKCPPARGVAPGRTARGISEKYRRAAPVPRSIG